jgi:hypothetical protein
MDSLVDAIDALREIAEIDPDPGPSAQWWDNLIGTTVAVSAATIQGRLILLSTSWLAIYTAGNDWSGNASKTARLVAATGHFVEAERLVEALPVDSKRGEWDTRRGSPRSTRYSPSGRPCSATVTTRAAAESPRRREARPDVVARATQLVRQHGVRSALVVVGLVVGNPNLT